MTQYNTLNVKSPNLQLNELKLAIQNCIEVTLKLSSNVLDKSNDELLLTNKKFRGFLKLLQIISQLI